MPQNGTYANLGTDPLQSELPNNLGFGDVFIQDTSTEREKEREKHSPSLSRALHDTRRHRKQKKTVHYQYVQKRTKHHVHPEQLQKFKQM